MEHRITISVISDNHKNDINKFDKIVELMKNKILGRERLIVVDDKHENKPIRAFESVEDWRLWIMINFKK